MHVCFSLAFALAQFKCRVLSRVSARAHTYVHARTHAHTHTSGCGLGKTQAQKIQALYAGPGTGRRRGRACFEKKKKQALFAGAGTRGRAVTRRARSLSLSAHARRPPYGGQRRWGRKALCDLQQLAWACALACAVLRQGRRVRGVLRERERESVCVWESVCV